jgi:CubicO group peptidase (beta-lactamase class C family)
MNHPDLSYLDSLIDEIMAHWHVPGLALAVIDGGEVVKLQGYGVRDIANPQPVSVDTQFSICSLTKSFTAAGLGLLVDAGQLEWNTRVREVLPDFQLYDPAATESVTVHNLLTHQSGLPRHDRIWSPPAARSRADILQSLRYLQLNRQRGEAPQYCNLGYVIAGAVIEQISGQSWEDFTTERLLHPLGFDRFSFTTDDLLTSDDHAHPHPREGAGNYRGRLWPMHAAPAGGINTSASNMAKWLGILLSQGNLNGSQILLVNVVQQMMSPYVLCGKSEFSEIGKHYFGLGLTCERYRGDRTVSHTGSMPGWGSMMSMMPEHGIGVVVLTNRDPSPVRDIVVYSVFDRLRSGDSREAVNWVEIFREQRLKSLETEAAEHLEREAQMRTWSAPVHPLRCFTGKYAHPAYGELLITEHSNTLAWTWCGLSGTLLSRDGKTFELKEDGDNRFNPPLQITFHFDAGDVITHLSSPLEPAVDAIVFQRNPA